MPVPPVDAGPHGPVARGAVSRRDRGDGDDIPLGLVLDRDFKNFSRTQRGMHQLGLTHLTVSPTEECRVVNIHGNLEECFGIEPATFA